MKIKDRQIGEGQPVFIIAEAGINHNGEVETAKKMIDAAKECGVDAIKFQTFTAEQFVSDEREMYEYETQGKKVKESMLKMFERYEFKKEDWDEIVDYCKKKEILFFSTPQNVEDLELLLNIGVPAIKVGSDDLVNTPLLEEYSKKGLPMIISTGMAYLPEIEEAIQTIKGNNTEVAVLHCVSSYPADFGELNLRKITSLKAKYPDVVVGFSDHSKGVTAAIAAVALGAEIIEKHFTLDRNMYGPDHRFSADPAELKELVAAVRNTEKALGSKEIKPIEKEVEMRRLCHRSIVAAENIGKGEELTKENLAMKRPGDGLSPNALKDILGKKARGDIKKNEKISLDKIC